MSIQALVGLALPISLFLAVLTVGMRVAPADLPYLVSRPSRLVRALVAMSVVAPVVTVIVAKTLSLHPAVIVGLVALAVSPVGALFSHAMLGLVAPGNAAYASGLYFASTVLSVILTPVIVEAIQAILGGDVHVHPLAVARVVVASVLLPLAIGLVLGRRWPHGRRWIPAMQKMSLLVLVVCFVAIVARASPYVVSVVRHGTLTAILLITLVGLAAGHALGGPGRDDRTVLACAMVSRHPGVAVVLAGLTDQPLAPIGVLLAFVVSEVAVVPYKLWRRRFRVTGPAGGGAAPGPIDAALDVAPTTIGAMHSRNEEDPR